MLPSPISVTIGANTHELRRINQDNFTSLFFKKGADYEVALTIRHSYEGKSANGQMERHQADLVYTTFDTDGNPVVTQSYVHLRMKRGTDGTLASDVATGLAAFMTASVDDIVAWES